MRANQEHTKCPTMRNILASLTRIQTSVSKVELIQMASWLVASYFNLMYYTCLPELNTENLAERRLKANTYFLNP
jgi:hypothetical protein